MRIGIDFGTTRTVVAAVKEGRYPVATFSTDAGFFQYLPSLAALDGDELRFGFEAQAVTDRAAAVVRSIKRSVAAVPHDTPIHELGTAAVASLELVTGYLRYVREMIVHSSNLGLAPGEELEAMVAVPAGVGTRQRYLTLEAFRRAGIRVLGMVNEPTAAAIEYAHFNLGALQRRSPKRYIVVYDLGGGTFDSAAVSLNERRYELLASEGVASLGGEDFDEAILHLALQARGIEEAGLDEVVRTRLLERCREMKEGLTVSSRKALLDFSDILPSAGEVVLATDAIYDACQPLIDRSVKEFDKLFTILRDRGIDTENPRELGAVYLVGGASAFPPVVRTLRALFKKKVQMAVQPTASTAVGLAIAADPEAMIFVRESSTRYFGIWREADHGHEQTFDPILEKNTAMPAGDQPIIVERCYRPVHSVGHLRFLECTALGDDGRPDGDITPWGDLYFPYDAALRYEYDLPQHLGKKRADGQADEIWERYLYDHRGTITVELENRTAGYKKRFLLGEMA